MGRALHRDARGVGAEIAHGVELCANNFCVSSSH